MIRVYSTHGLTDLLHARARSRYIGYSWMGCIQPSGFVQGNATGWEGYPRPKEIEVDYGEPVRTHACLLLLSDWHLLSFSFFFFLTENHVPH